MIKSSSLFFFMALLPTVTGAWGPRGHFAICQVAVDLVRDENLKEFLKSRRHIMGHLCNIPDNAWKNAEYEITSIGNPAHYIDPENLNKKLEELPADFSQIAKEMKTSNYQLHFLLGGLWWRADQFYRRALEAAKKIDGADRSSAKTKKKRVRDLSPYETQVYSMMVNMGLMGHFVGDASMPYHNTLNFDGWANGRGGIHSYYESDVVDELSFDFTEKFFKAAKGIELPKLKSDANFVVERMRSLSIMARDEIPKVEKEDLLLKPSATKEIRREATIGKPPSPRKEYAKRPPAENMVSKFEPLILQQMARSALALAEFWDRMYAEAKKPSLKEYANYKFPFEPEFVWPDYFDQE